jgi:methionyl-tRNA formyltransferase
MVAAPHTDALRVVFFGTPEFAVPTLEALRRSRHRMVGVVTQPDRPRGRGHKTSDAPVKAHALAAGVPLLQPERLRDPAFVAALSALAADLAVVAAYGKILTDEVLAVPPLGFINVHASLLPRYRGAAPVHRAILAGERETGVTIMRVVQALDAGPMLASVRRPIGPDETSEDVERDLARLGAGLLVSTVDAIADGHVIETPQDEGASTYAHRLTKDDGAIDWTQPAGRIHNQIRGLHPWPHAFSFLNGRRFILRRSAVLPGLTGAAGTVVEAAGDRLTVAAGTGGIAILEIQTEGKRPLSPREFLAGHRVTPGHRFAPQPGSTPGTTGSMPGTPGSMPGSKK